MLREIFKGLFPTKAPLTGIGEKWQITDIKAFDMAKFSVVDVRPEGRKLTTLKDLGITEGDVLAYNGRGSGGKRKYIVVYSDSMSGVEINMSYKADGKPESFGLAKYEDPDMKILNAHKAALPLQNNKA